jgi:hypothetical protein
MRRGDLIIQRVGFSLLRRFGRGQPGRFVAQRRRRGGGARPLVGPRIPSASGSGAGPSR